MREATVSALVEYDVKTEAEEIMEGLGTSASEVIGSLYHQIIIRHDIPFPMTNAKAPRTMDEMSHAEFNAKLTHSYQQSLAGQGRPYQDVFDDLEKGLL